MESIFAISPHLWDKIPHLCTLWAKFGKNATAKAPIPDTDKWMAKMNPFTLHPAEAGESYGEHLRMAGRFGGKLCLAGIACLLHALFPFLFKRTGSRMVGELHAELSERARHCADSTRR